jgi:hypothetical protein
MGLEKTEARKDILMAEKLWHYREVRIIECLHDAHRAFKVHESEKANGKKAENALAVSAQG